MTLKKETDHEAERFAQEDYSFGYQKGLRQGEEDANDSTWTRRENNGSMTNEELGFMDAYNSIETVECPRCHYGCKKLVQHETDKTKKMCSECAVADM